MEQKATPWRTLRDRAAGLLSEDGRDLSEEVLEVEEEDVDGEDTVPNEEREQRKEEGDEAALARVEGWAEEVKNYLTSEIAVLRIQKAARKKGPVWYACTSSFSTLWMYKADTCSLGSDIHFHPRSHRRFHRILLPFEVQYSANYRLVAPLYGNRALRRPRCKVSECGGMSGVSHLRHHSDMARTCVSDKGSGLGAAGVDAAARLSR